MANLIFSDISQYYHLFCTYIQIWTFQLALHNRHSRQFRNIGY